MTCQYMAALTSNLRYTKALDNIKALRKERIAELKVDRERLKFYKGDKDKAERVRIHDCRLVLLLTQRLLDEEAARGGDQKGESEALRSRIPQRRVRAPA
jgi:hypothetical protein